MKNIISFGEIVKGYDVKVLNEREVRAGAGILFLVAMISSMNALILRDFYMMKIFIIMFIVDFIIRIFINPKYAPSLILGRFFVRKQKPECVGALQKKFAWILGLIMASTVVLIFMTVGVIGPVCLLCFICLTLLFFESAFGICLGCILFNYFNKGGAKLCPGGTCEVTVKEEIQKINYKQVVVLIFTIIFIILLSKIMFIEDNNNTSCGDSLNHSY